MDWLTKETITLTTVILGFIGTRVDKYFTDKKKDADIIAKEKARDLAEAKKQEERDAKQDARELENAKRIEDLQNSISSTSARLAKIEQASKSVETKLDLVAFEKRFVRDFKRSNREVVRKVNTSKDLTDFLNGGVKEIAEVFKAIIDSQFEMTNEEIESEFSEAQTTLSAKFKAKNPEYSVFVSTVEAEIIRFVTYYQDVKVKENGDRMRAFKTLCQRTIVNIITKIAKTG